MAPGHGHYLFCGGLPTFLTCWPWSTGNIVVDSEALSAVHQGTVWKCQAWMMCSLGCQVASAQPVLTTTLALAPLSGTEAVCKLWLEALLEFQNSSLAWPGAVGLSWPAALQG